MEEKLEKLVELASKENATKAKAIAYEILMEKNKVNIIDFGEIGEIIDVTKQKAEKKAVIKKIIDDTKEKAENIPKGHFKPMVKEVEKIYPKVK